MEYATEGISNQLFISRYMLYLPDRKTLERELYKVLDKKWLGYNYLSSITAIYAIFA